MARNPRANQGTVPVFNKFGNTTGDKPGIVGVVDQVMEDLGAVSFRSIEAGTGISVEVVDADNNRFSTKDKKIVIRNTGSGAGEANTGSNLGGGTGVFAGKSGSDLQFKSLVAGSGVSLSSTGTEITINSTGGGAANLDDLLDVDLTTTPPLPGDALVFDGLNWVPQAGGAGSGEANTASNIGVGNGVFSSKVGTDLQFKSLIAGSNISINDNGNDLTINATGTGEVNDGQNVGGDQTLFVGKSGTLLQFKGLTAGANVALSSSPNAVTISVPTVGEVNTGQNVGPGEDVFLQKAGTFLQFKTLVAGSNIAITPAADHLVVSSTAPGEVNTMSNLGTGEGVFAQKNGVDFELKSLVAGPNISLTSDGQTITIDATAAGESNSAVNIGTGVGEVFKQKTGTDLELRKIKAGTNVAVGIVGDDIVISASGDIEGAQNLGGGAPLFALETGGQLQFRSLVAGSNVNLAYTGSEITIGATGESNSGLNLGAGEGVFTSKSGTNLQFRSLVAGTGVTLTGDADEITINAPGAGEANDGVNLGTGSPLFAGKSGTDLQFKSLIAGPNISLLDSGSAVTISASTAGEANTAQNVGTGVGRVFKQKTGVEFQFKSIVAGTNVSITNNPDEIIIDSPDTTATATNLGLGQGVFASKVGNDLQFRSLIAGTGVTLNTTGTDITIDAVGEANTASNIGTGVGLFDNKFGSDLRFKSIISGDGLDITVGGNDITVDVTTDGANVGTTITNVGNVFRDKTGGDTLNFRKLVGGANVTITESADEILIDSTGVGGSGEVNTGANVGAGGVGPFKTKTGPVLEFKNINAGSSKVSVVDNIGSDEIDIDVVPGNILTSTLNNDAGFISNVATLDEIGDVDVGVPGASEDGYVLVWDNSSSSYILEDPGNLSAIGLAVRDAVNLGSGFEVFKQKVGFDIEFRTLTAGSGVVMNQSGTEIEISIGGVGAGEANTASNVGGGDQIFKQKNGVDLEFRTLVAGSNISINQNTDTVEIEAINVGSVEDGLNIGAGREVFRDKDSLNNLRFRSLLSLNSNLVITQDPDEIIFESLGEPNTASNVGTGVGVFKQKTGEDLEFKSLTTSNGMQINSALNTVDLIAGKINSVEALGIINPLTDFSVLADNGTTVIDGIADDPTYGPELKELNLRSFRAGAGITLGLADNTIVISSDAALAGGSDLQIQYNNGGNFAGDVGFTTNGAGSLTVTGDITIDDISVDGNVIDTTEEEIVIGEISYTRKDTVTINNNITGGPILTYSKVNYDVAFIEYILHRGTDGARGGSLTVVYDPVSDDVAIADAGTDVLDPGVEFNASVVGSDIEVTYNSTNSGQVGSMTYSMRRWAV